MKGIKLLFIASWVLLLLLSGAIVLVSIGSMYTAYTGAQDSLTESVNLDEIRSIGGDEAVQAFRGRRLTAASWAMAYGLLSMAVVLVPYRRAEKWAWWALLAGLGIPQLLSMFRYVVIGGSLGVGTSGTVMAFLLLGLLAGAPRFFGRRPSLSD